MSLAFIHLFQSHIYSLITANEEIAARINKVYLSVTQDAKHPFILIHILEVDNLSKFHHVMYQVNFEVCIFTKDKNQRAILQLADHINGTLAGPVASFEDYFIAGINNIKIDLESAHDLVTTKLSIHYKALIKQVE